MTYTGCNRTVKPHLHAAAFPDYTRCGIVWAMADRRTYLREWRVKRELTQRQVADRLAVFDDDKLPTTEASLSRIETGAQIYTQRILEALAEIYQCDPADLLGKNPLIDSTVVDMVARLPQHRQAQVAAFIHATEPDESAQTAQFEPPPLAAVADQRVGFVGQGETRLPGGAVGKGKRR